MYGDIEIVITENGFGGPESSLEDYQRIHYYEKHLEQVYHYFLLSRFISHIVKAKRTKCDVRVVLSTLKLYFP